jgi:hypothetical protein
LTRPEFFSGLFTPRLVMRKYSIIKLASASGAMLKRG